jgi:hypothetical protein
MICAPTVLQAIFTAVAADKWTEESVALLARAMAYLDLNARYYESAGEPKKNGVGTVCDHIGTALRETMWTAFTHAHLGQWKEAQWAANYLLGYVLGGDLRRPSSNEDTESFELVKTLLQALADDRWPAEFSPSLGPYHQLLAQRHDAEAVAQALVRVTDLRVARWFGYAQIDDARPMHPHATLSLMGEMCFAAMPAELWAIKALARRFDGIELNLDADHPWLRAGFMQPPTMPLPAFDDELLQALRNLGDSKFPAGWRDQ